MKNKTKKIAQYSALVLAAATVLPMACKKDAKEVDDPEIDVITPNLTITSNGSDYKSIDTILNIGSSKINLEMEVSNMNSGYRYVYLDFDDESYLQNGVQTPVNGENWEFLPILSSGTVINNINAPWSEYNDDGYLFVDDKNPIETRESKGINGQGDKYFAFRNGNAPSYKYGWMKVNVSSDGNTFTLKEIALANVANKAIKVGDK